MKNNKGQVFSIVRTYSAGVFAGYIGKVTGKLGTVFNARRLWYWYGAAYLSQLARDGTSRPSECKFAVPVASVTLTEIIEVIPCTEKAYKSITGVAEWKS
jgi:hypothetical protein